MPAKIALNAFYVARSARSDALECTITAMKRSCARPTCAIAAAATMSYDYEARILWIESLHYEDHPMAHDLCIVHADRSKPPQGWELRDERTPRGIYAQHAS